MNGVPAQIDSNAESVYKSWNHYEKGYIDNSFFNWLEFLNITCNHMKMISANESV